MTAAALADRRNRCVAVAIKLKLQGRPVEAARWRAEADRYECLLLETMPVFGAKAVA